MHTTAYCGSLERSCLKLGIPILSVTDNQSNYTYCMATSADALLQQWKNGAGQMGKMLPKYKSQPVDETPVIAEVPNLQICKVEDDVLTVPPDIRRTYLNDPARAPEWRKILQDFDRRWASEVQSGTPSTTANGSTPSRANGSTPSRATTSSESLAVTPSGSDDPPAIASDFDWGTVFPEEPKTKTDFEAKYASLHTFTVSGNMVGVIVEGPKLFLVASGECSLTVDEPILMFGAGVWLLDAKASAFLEECSMFFTFGLWDMLQHYSL